MQPPAPPVPAAPPAPPAARSPAPEARDLAALLEPIRAKHNLPALAGVIVQGDKIVAQGVVGVRRAGDDTKATIDDLWHLGSCTKSMTATLCAILVEKGKMRWDMTLAETFPDLADKMHPDFRAVTLAQLCSNRGGVPTDLTADGLWGRLWNAKGTDAEVRRILLEGVTGKPPAYPPGSKFMYANGGFALAGLMAETVMHKPYEELMHEYIFKPLGMASAGWGAPGKPRGLGGAGEPPDQPRGHNKDGAPVEPTPNHRGADNPPAISPAGRVHMTIGDWAKYISLHLRGDPHNPNRECRLLTPESFDRLHTPAGKDSEYAYGWGRPERPWAGPAGDRFVLTHNGSNTMWFCVTWIAPAKDFAVLVCTNTGIEAAGKAADEAAAALIGDFTRHQGAAKP